MPLYRATNAHLSLGNVQWLENCAADGAISWLLCEAGALMAMMSSIIAMDSFK